MRYKVVFKSGSGYVIYGEHDYERALDMMKTEGLRMLRLEDDGREVLMFGLPEFVDLTIPDKAYGN